MNKEPLAAVVLEVFKSKSRRLDSFSMLFFFRMQSSPIFQDARLFLIGHLTHYLVLPSGSDDELISHADLFLFLYIYFFFTDTVK